jgi:hypothetical protein
LQGILKKYCAKPSMHKCGCKPTTFGSGGYMLSNCSSYSLYDNSAEKDIVPEKMAMRRFQDFVHIIYETFHESIL